MAEPLEQENEDPWAVGPEPARPSVPWCDICEGAHDDHAAWLAEKAVAVRDWSESVKAAAEKLAGTRALARELGIGQDADDAGILYGEASGLIADLRRIADAAAWRALREAEEAAAVTGWCGHCGTRLTLLGGAWTDGDGVTACTDLSAPYVPHAPKEASRG
jgi:hypothetical protein